MERVDMHPQVYKAAQSGDFESLRTNGEDLLHQKTRKENNILHVAAQYEQVKFMKDLLQCGSGPSLLRQRNSKGDTPLHVAAKVGSWEAVRVFAELTKSLHSGVDNEQVDACKELFRMQNNNKDTALHHAIRGGHDLVVELLIDEDPQLLDMTNAAGESPLYLAADRGLSYATELILGAFSSSSSHSGPEGLTALHAGMSLPLTSWEKIMDKRPELIKEADRIGWTPLHYVAYRGRVEAVRLLLLHETSMAHDPDEAGQSALHLAASEGHVNVIDEIVRSCPDACDITNTEGQTALHTAVICGRVNVVKYILRMPNQDDLINEHDIDGYTALHLAALHKQYIIIYILARDKRVDLLAKNKDHLTAYDIFLDHKELGLRASNVRYLLKESRGLPGFQGWFDEHGKKRLNKQFVQGQPSVSRTTGSDIVNRDNLNMQKKSVVDIQLLVAVLIATGTFTAIFTMPGGYNDDGPDQGMAIHAGKAIFKAFLAFNTTAFVYSIMAIFLHFHSFTFSHRQEPKYILTVGSCIVIATIGMVLAYGMGMSVVLHRSTKSIGNGFLPYLADGYPLVFAFVCLFSNHKALSWLRGSSPTRYIRECLIECDIRLNDFLAWFTSGH